MSAELGDLAGLAGQLAERARQLAAQASASAGTRATDGRAADSSNAATASGSGGIAAPAESPDLAAVRLARELRTLAADALRLAVKEAHAGGHTWPQIAALLDLSPQAAFQRFGRAEAPKPPAGEPITEPAAPAVPDAADRAVTILADWFDERYDTVAATFDATLAQNMPPAALAAARAQVVGTAGQYCRLGDPDPLVRQVGDYTLADVPMLFEGGLMKGRVTFTRTGSVAGLYVLPPATP